MKSSRACISMKNERLHNARQCAHMQAVVYACGIFRNSCLHKECCCLKAQEHIAKAKNIKDRCVCGRTPPPPQRNRLTSLPTRWSQHKKALFFKARKELLDTKIRRYQELDPIQTGLPAQMFCLNLLKWRRGRRKTKTKRTSGFLTNRNKGSRA